MRNLKQSVASNVMVFMADSADHIAGKTGLTLSISASKNGGAFAAITPAVTERGSGWYSLALTSSHLDTLGDLAVHVTATGADPTDFLCRVVAGSLDADVSMAQKILRNKMITDPATGMLTIYDDDGVTVLLSGHIYKDAAGSVPYNGTGAERRERLA